MTFQAFPFSAAALEPTMNSKVLINEVYDFEFKARWRSGRKFILNSAWQGNLDYKTNIFHSKYLRAKMREELGLDVLKIMGRYVEQAADVECMVSFPPEGMDDELIKRFFYLYGRRFKQNGIIIVDEGDIVWTLPTRPNSTYGAMGKLIRGYKFTCQKFVPLVSDFMRQTYVFDMVKILTD